MAGTQLSEFRTQLVSELGNRAGEAEANLTRWFNEAYLWLCAYVRPFELEKTGTFILAQGARTINIPTAVKIGGVAITDFFSVYDVRNDTVGKRLVPVSARAIDALEFPNELVTTPQQRPEQYCRYGLDVIFDQTSDASYNHTFRYNARPSKLINATDPVVTGSEYDEVLLNSALWRAKCRLEYPKESTDRILEMNSRILGSLRRQKTEEGDDVEMGLVPIME
jgi:hypothetical protein